MRTLRRMPHASTIWTTVLVLATLLFVLVPPAESGAGDPVSTPDIIEMLSAQIAETIIHAKIERDGCSCDTSAGSIIALQRAGASDELVLRLIEISDDGGE
jgi:hypothetical protein